MCYNARMSLLSFTILFSAIALVLGAISLRLHLWKIRITKTMLDEAKEVLYKEEKK